jgi:hypothetical protein
MELGVPDVHSVPYPIRTVYAVEEFGGQVLSLIIAYPSL